MYIVRRWSVRKSRFLESLYNIFEPVFVLLHPLWRMIGYQRVEKPMRVVEKAAKKLLFDCQMCGQCVLSSTGMSCPMNCPKTIRNGPCGGVRLDGSCEVKPEMQCVWVEAWLGNQNLRESKKIHKVQVPVNFSYKGSSSWLRVAQQQIEARQNGVQS
ncbi:MAG: hypothetical protein HKN34_10015 [Gammaproteobacteria bacterium]|nr:hypothetical protein [Gammaproteobacteria bacterium]